MPPLSVVGSATPPSACQLQCKKEQKELVSCMDTIRNSGKNECLEGAVASWTQCCAAANTREETAN